MRLVDLRSSSPAVTLEVKVLASSAAELLRLIGVLSHGEARDYDIGAERIEQIRSSVPTDLLADINELQTADKGFNFLLLSLIAATLPEPAGVDELLEALREDPGQGWRLLVAHESQQVEEVTDELEARLLEGDPGAIAQLREVLAEGGSTPSLDQLLATDPQTHGERLADVIERFEALVWQDLAEEAMAPIRRDAAHHQQRLDQGDDPSAVIVAATNGYEPPDDAKLRRIVLLPSYWMRPWLVVGSRGVDVEIISTVVADEFLVLPSEAPPPALLKLAKALSDESRLKLLRRMASGPVSLTEATETLSVTKGTAHHHLSILRQAGLVSMRGTGRSTRYALRENPADAAHQALEAYCCR